MKEVDNLFKTFVEQSNKTNGEELFFQKQGKTFSMRKNNTQDGWTYIIRYIGNSEEIIFGYVKFTRDFEELFKKRVKDLRVEFKQSLQSELQVMLGL